MERTYVQSQWAPDLSKLSDDERLVFFEAMAVFDLQLRRTRCGLDAFVKDHPELSELAGLIPLSDNADFWSFYGATKFAPSTHYGRDYQEAGLYTKEIHLRRAMIRKLLVAVYEIDYKYVIGYMPPGAAIELARIRPFDHYVYNARHPCSLEDRSPEL